jgi:hypothetical protein
LILTTRPNAGLADASALRPARSSWPDAVVLARSELEWHEQQQKRSRLMFVGHYGPSFAVKAWKKTIPLWVLFLAVQFVDILWSVFVLLGVEKVRTVPGITATNPFDLYYMPYTHSLLAAVLWSVIAAMSYWVLLRANGWVAAAIVGGAVFSHWILDLLVHRSDLPLYDDMHKVGLGLWNYPGPAFALEIALLFGGVFLYLRTTEPKDDIGRYGMVIFALITVAVQAFVSFGPPPASDKAFATAALALYFGFAAIVYWLEGKRS